MDRIHKAGRFDNQFGRVNGNLNLSLSIGDLKNKQVPGTPTKTVNNSSLLYQADAAYHQFRQECLQYAERASVVPIVN
jgi:hypothetical protein